MKKDTFLWLCFLGVATIIFSNINGLVYMLLGIIAPFSIFILIGCLILAYFLFRYKRISFPLFSLNVCLISFVLVGFISWCFLEHLHFKDIGYLRLLRKQLPGILLLYVFYKFTLYQGDKGNLNQILFAVVLMLMVITLTIPFGSLMGLKEMVSYRSGSRESGFFANPNMAGAHINYTLALVLFFAVNSRRLFLLFLVGIPITLYAGFVTFSKSTIIVSVFILLLFFAFHIQGFLQLGQKRRFRFGVLIMCIVVFAIIAAPTVVEYVGGLATHL